MSDAAPQPLPMLSPGPVPADEPRVSLEKQPEHPLIPGEAPPGWPQPGQEWQQPGHVWAQPGQDWSQPGPGWQQPGPAWQQTPPPNWQQGQYVEQPPPGWVGKWHPPVPPTPTDDPSTWPQLGVAPGAGPNVGSWAVAHSDEVPDDRS